MAHHSMGKSKEITIPIFIMTPHPMLPISQESTIAYSIFMDDMFLVLLSDLDSSIDPYFTHFHFFGNYH
jgi:hypothetical protein